MNFMMGGGGMMEPMAMDSDSGSGSGSASVGASVVEREHMFDKVVTPSDVGKLNRLVIPKQHAEKYFPLDSTVNEKGLLLNFEDRNGKPWRFRYSYWNSSQSYVMTKGWSRFVKEKKLDAGDIISFQRGAGDAAKDRLFIDWRRRPDAVHLPPSALRSIAFPHHFSLGRSIHPWTSLLSQQPLPVPPWNHAYGCDVSHFGHGVVVNPCFAGVTYLGSAPAGAGGSEMQRGLGMVRPNLVLESVPVVQGKAAAKRLRLFGVNMDCPIPESDECDDNLPISTIRPPHFPHLSNMSPVLESTHYTGKGKESMSLDLDI